MSSFNTRVEVATAVARPLIEMEKHLDSAIALQARVLIEAIDGRRKARLPLHSGQEAIERLTDAVERMIAARKAVHEAHLLFREVRDEMGVGPVGYGDHGDTPLVVNEPSGAHPALTVVGAA